MRVGSYGGIGLKAVGVARSSVLTSEETVKICERGRDRKKKKIRGREKILRVTRKIKFISHH